MITNYGANANIGKNPFVGVATGANGTIEDIRKQNFPTSTTSTQQAAAPTASPALAAMQQTGSTGGAPTQLGTRAVPAGMATGATPGSTPPVTPPRTDLVTPTSVDTSKQDQLAQQQMSTYNQGWDTQQKQNELNWSRMQMGNASNAARSGMSIGGGSYLAGQRQAGIAATNANNQATLDWLKGQAGITGDAATRAANAATTNATLGQQGNIFNAGREGDIATQQTNAQTTQNANQATGSVAQVKANYDYLFDKHNYQGGSGQYNSLLTAYQNSLSTGNADEQAKAYQALMGFISPIQQARQAWVDSGGQDKNGDFKDWYKSHGGQ